MDSAAEPRSAYAHLRWIPTRWADNDIYGHVNNVEYYSFFDTVINSFVDRESRRPVEIIGPLRDALRRLIPAP